MRLYIAVRNKKGQCRNIDTVTGSEIVAGLMIFLGMFLTIVLF